MKIIDVIMAFIKDIDAQTGGRNDVISKQGLLISNNEIIAIKKQKEIKLKNTKNQNAIKHQKLLTLITTKEI